MTNRGGAEFSGYKQLEATITQALIDLQVGSELDKISRDVWNNRGRINTVMAPKVVLAPGQSPYPIGYELRTHFIYTRTEEQIVYGYDNPAGALQKVEVPELGHRSLRIAARLQIESPSHKLDEDGSSHRSLANNITPAAASYVRPVLQPAIAREVERQQRLEHLQTARHRESLQSALNSLSFTITDSDSAPRARTTQQVLLYKDDSLGPEVDRVAIFQEILRQICFERLKSGQIPEPLDLTDSRGDLDDKPLHYKAWYQAGEDIKLSAQQAAANLLAQQAANSPAAIAYRAARLRERSLWQRIIDWIG